MKYLILCVLFCISCSDVSRNEAITRGEKIFNDNSFYTTGKSCNSCHPSGNTNNRSEDVNLGRIWDTQSLWNVGSTAPYLWDDSQGTLDDAVTHLFNNTAISYEQKDITDIVTYMKSLKSPLSPFRTTLGELNETQKRGKLLFEGRGNCTPCHGGEFFTDNTKRPIKIVGTDTSWINTPSLLGMWDTAPYWHNGNMKTIKDVLTNHKWIIGTSFKVNPSFTAEEISDLESYLNAL